eukprot:CAMPEP_0197847474 /NCGR_PEP_ID=MMETSP1438-20131217/6332_1 /TAXON_ID=1461541 /ORGANISM="Pterosperma sp., Strain CCMP1384" /LENGTH=315 /DNA_ID=CAMNT_0043459409 /DNA_START=363 /DNA_END=1310 /DNA_ORIENTATION=-
MTTADYEHTKTSLVDVYNGGVDAWNNEYREDLARTSWQLKIDNHTIPLVTIDTPEPLEKVKDAHAYQALRFATPPVLPISDPAATLMGSGDVNIADPRLKYTDSSGGSVPDVMRPREISLIVEDQGRTQELELPPIPLLQKEVKRSGGWKVCKYQHAGFYSGRGQSCTTYNVLAGICLKVSKHENGTWAFNSTYGGSGCSSRTGWRMYSWHRVQAPSSGRPPTIPDLQRVEFPDLVVRSAFDPHILALHMTAGKLIFAEPQAEELATGLVLIIIGSVAFLPACLLCYPIYRAYRQRKRREAYHYDHQADEVDYGV